MSNSLELELLGLFELPVASLLSDVGGVICIG